ncbi:hypothetical protein [Arthrobacter sp. M4]|uniref:hypothetical protein n=1 Tax=Arthrobacter sp. M4 TaxID=218160 RepID=UPI001CDBC5FC|nr:hypothetical protein [Arthrobacter sp. M4]MCA4133132.1 hypothetical protein [Arthrobacter sp. M4]
MVHLTHPHGRRAVRRKGVKGHQATLVEADIVQGRLVACTSPLRTWFDLAQILTDDELVIAGDHLLKRQNPLSAVQELDDFLSHQRGRAGYRKAVRARSRMRPRTDSPKETEVRLLLVDHGLPEPVINVPLFDEAGRWVQDPDMSYEDFKVLIQYDGAHHVTPQQRRSDIFRDEEAKDLGWRVVQLTQSDLDTSVGGVPRAVARVKKALLGRGWTEPQRPAVSKTASEAQA